VAALAGALVLGTIAQSAAVGVAAPHVRHRASARAFFDARSSGAAASALHARAARLAASPSLAVTRLGRALGEEGVIQIDPLTATPRIVANLNGFLTRPSAAAPRSVALGFVQAHPRVFKLSARSMGQLHLVRNYVDIDGTSHLGWAQTVHGVPLFGNGLQASVAANGRLINVTGSPVSDLGGVSTVAQISASAALRAARADLGGARPTPEDSAKKVLFQTLGGTRLAWQTVLMTSPDAYLTVIDARTGGVLFRKDLTDDANGKVFTYWPGGPRGGQQHVVNFTARGWLPASRRFRLEGNNAHVFTDVNDDNVAEPSEEVPASTDHSWSYTFTPFNTPAGGPPCLPHFPCSWNPNVANSWKTNRAQNATQVFFYVNNYHDHLAAPPIGFTEAAGNFQQVNHSGNGKGGDPLLAQPDDGANTGGGLPDPDHVDNANMSTPPDGTSPVMQMYLFHTPFSGNGDPFLASNGGDEADIVYHEYTHGLSDRLVVDANGVSTLDGAQSGAMGEAWSDWYALDFLTDLGLQPNTRRPGEVMTGRYVSENVNIVRTQPIDCTVGAPASRCPGTPGGGTGGYTYGDFGKIIGGPEVHADGEIWSETLWDLRTALGSKLTEKLVTRAMELSPAEPTFLDMRNAIIQADRADNGGRAHRTIWRVFAHRGMGYFAATTGTGDVNPIQDFHLPPGPHTPTGGFSGRVTNADTGAPMAGVRVFFGGHASGFPGASLESTSGPNGRFAIHGIFVGRYRDVVAFAPGFDLGPITQRIRAGQTAHHHFRLRRDWASARGGATVVSADGTDFSDFGCGPLQAIDQSPAQGWSTTSDLSGGGQATPATPKSIVVKLPNPVHVSSFAVDPTNTCGDDPGSATGDFRIATSTNGTTFTPAATGTFTPADLGRLNAVAPTAGATGVRYVRFTMVNPQVLQTSGGCPGPSSGCVFMDVTELEVYGTATG
jgi:hypothetical protein